MRRINQKKVKKLYLEYGPLILNYLENQLHLQKPDAEDVLHITFEKVALNLEKVRDEKTYKNWIFKIAKNAFFDYLKNQRKYITGGDGSGVDESADDDSENDPFNDPQASVEAFELMEKRLCLQMCIEKALSQYEHDHPDVFCPSLILLRDNGSSIEEIADSIYQSIPETNRRLKRCQEKKKHYKNFEAYQKACGSQSLCWLIIQLTTAGWTRKQIAEVVNKSEAAVTKAASRCREKMNHYMKNCKDCD